MHRQQPNHKKMSAKSWWRGEILYAGLGIGLALGLFPSAAFAYFDPNAGSMLFQLLSPVIFIAASVMLAVRGGIRTVVKTIGSVFRRDGAESVDVQPEK